MAALWEPTTYGDRLFIFRRSLDDHLNPEIFRLPVLGDTDLVRERTSVLLREVYPPDINYERIIEISYIIRTKFSLETSDARA